jgi:hypothetical protein
MRTTLAALRQFFKDLDYQNVEFWTQERCIKKLALVRVFFENSTLHLRNRPSSQQIMDALKLNEKIELLVDEQTVLDITPS